MNTRSLMRLMTGPSMGLAATALLAGCASVPPAVPEAATCPSDAAIAQQVQIYRQLALLPNPETTLTLAGAECGAAKFVRALAPTHGKVVGYKAGLTNPVVQQRFGVNQPLRGTLLEKMLLADGAEVPAKFGARPFTESDLIVEVAGPAIHDAKTPLEVLQSLRSVRPFIELPDTQVQDPSRINAPTLVLINVGARLGVLGAPLPVRADAAFADALRDMTVRTTDASGKELAAGKGSAIMGHPLNAVIWLAAELKKAGITLKGGELLSLGTFAPTGAEPGSTLTVTYDGLPGNPRVSVRLR